LILNSFPPPPRTLMRLIWSALWGAFPGEIHLISEFLIPSLRAPALAPLAAPQEVKGRRQSQTTGEGTAGMLQSPQPPTRPPTVQSPSCTTAGQAPRPQVSALRTERRQPHLCIFWSGQKALSQGPRNPKPRRFSKGVGAEDKIYAGISLLHNLPIICP
jgi:hypothetical protein